MAQQSTSTATVNHQPTVKYGTNEYVADEWGVVFDSYEARDAFVAQFPRYVGIKAAKLWDTTGTRPYASVRFNLNQSDGTTGAANEAAAKRYRKAWAVVDAMGCSHTVYMQPADDETVAALRSINH